MAHVAGHLSVEALEARYEACDDVMSSRHFQTIWLLAKGHSTGEVAAMTSFGQRWIEQLLERYNAFGPSALGDLRRGNGAPAKVLTPELLRRLRVRLGEPPPESCTATSTSPDLVSPVVISNSRDGVLMVCCFRPICRAAPSFNSRCPPVRTLHRASDVRGVLLS